jgi:hypothetical protein
VATVLLEVTSVATCVLSWLLPSRVSLTLQVPASCRAGVKRLVKTYAKYCRKPTAVRRQSVLRQAKDLDRLMMLTPKRAAALAGGVAGVSRPAHRQPATLDDVNNNLRLLVDAVRRLAEATAIAVRRFLSCISHC